jgi:hypothetical protein
MCYDPAEKALLALFLAAAAASGADNAADAARELARKTVAFAGRGEPVSTNWRNLSPLGSAELTEIRSAFEAGVREAGGRSVDSASSTDARLTVSENQAGYLLVEEVRKADERQVWMAAWKKGPAASSGPHASLTRTLLWEQDEPILDVAVSGQEVVVLSPGSIRWTKAGLSARIVPDRPLPRDPRGRLRAVGGSLEAQLPGMVCRSAQPGAAECRASEEPWTIDSGSRRLLLAYLSPGRNYFDGRVTVQTGQRKTLPPFYSAAALEQPGGTQWVLALTDGRAQIFDSNWESGAAIPNWGSDIAGSDLRCGGGPILLATRPGEAREGDAVQAFTVMNGSATPNGRAVDFNGPVTALWPAGPLAYVVVVRNPEGGRYSAYLVSVACSS